MYKLHSGNFPDNFNRLFTPVNHVHCHATRSATMDVYFWQMAHTKYGKGLWSILALRSGTILIPLYTTAPRAHLKNSTDMYLSLYMMTDSMVLKHGVLYVNCSPLLFQIAHFPLIIFPPRIAICIPYFSYPYCTYWSLCDPVVFAHPQCGLEPRNLDGANLGSCWCHRHARRIGQRELLLPCSWKSLICVACLVFSFLFALADFAYM